MSYKAEYRAAVPVVKERSGGWCEINVPHPCVGKATQWPHHRKLRSQGGSNDPDTNLLDVCWSGHLWIHETLSRDEAVRLGLITPSYAEELPYNPQPDPGRERADLYAGPVADPDVDGGD